MILFDQSSTAQKNPQGLIQRAWVRYKGNTSWPNPGTTKYLQMVAIANDLLRWEYALDEKIQWDSLWTTRTYGPIRANTQAYQLDSDVFYLSDFVYILRTDGNTDRFQVVHPEQRNRGFQGVGMVGSDNGDPITYLTGSSAGGESNLTLNFEDNFVPGGNMAGDIGGAIQVGCYALPDELQNASDSIPVNNPGWLVVRLAAEMARNDPAKEDQFTTLQASADKIYQNMVVGNQGNSFQQPSGPMYVNNNMGVTWQQF